MDVNIKKYIWISFAGIYLINLTVKNFYEIKHLKSATEFMDRTNIKIDTEDLNQEVHYVRSNGS